MVSWQNLATATERTTTTRRHHDHRFVEFRNCLLVTLDRERLLLDQRTEVLCPPNTTSALCIAQRAWWTAASHAACVPQSPENAPDCHSQS
eukprot:1594349-Rhodomonas_salina.1